MASKEKVDIVRSDQFQEVDEELTRAMAELDSTIERVSLIFQSNSESDTGTELLPEEPEIPETAEAAPPEPVASAAEPVATPAGKDASESR